MADKRYINTHGGKVGYKIKYKGRLIAFLALLLIITIALLINYSPIFVVNNDSISITGDERYHFEDIIISAKDELVGVNIFKIDEDAVQNMIQDDNPYLEVLNIVRALPNKIEIIVKEREPVFQFTFNGQHFDAGENRVIMSDPRSKDPALIQVEGVAIEQPVRGSIVGLVNKQQQDDFDSLIKNLKAYNFMDKVRLIDMADEGNIIIWLRQNFKVIIGMPTQLQGKIESLSVALDSLIDNGKTSGVLNISTVGELVYSPFEDE